MKTVLQQTRRDFLRTSLMSGLAMAAGSRFAILARADAAAPKTTSRVALMAGDDRANNVFRGLKVFEKEIASAIGNRRVVLKPNNVVVDVPLCATHASCLEATLEFLKSIGKLQNAVIAESAANGPAIEGFTNYGYTRVAEKYGVKMLDLDEGEVQIVHVFDEKDFRPHAVRMSKLLLDRNNFIISAAKLKTHDRIVATLSLKNIVFGAPVKDAGFRWGKACKPGAKCDKPIAHGSGFRAINYNLFALAPRLHPHLSIIDGYDGMEGNGPVRGTEVDHKVCVVSPDWLAADRTGVELMGIDFAKIGYLNFCAQARMGEADMSKIEIVGEPVARHIKSYKLATNVEKQLIWMTPPKAES